MKTDENERVDIHHKQEGYEDELESLKECDILPENKNLILTFVDEYGDGNEPATKIKYITQFRWFAKLLRKSFLKVDRTDIKKLEKAIENNPPLKYYRKPGVWKSQKNKKKSSTTIDSYKKDLRLFYKWIHHSYLKESKKDERRTGKKLREILKKKPVPELVEDVVSDSKTNNNLKAKDMLSWEEIVKMSQTTNHPQQKAVIQILGETGLRATELLTLRAEDLEIKKMGDRIIGIVHVRQSKTENNAGIRSIAIINSVPAAIEWLKIRPFRDRKDSPLWLEFSDKWHNFDMKNPTQMSYASLTKLLNTSAIKANIAEKHNAQHIRKSRASLLAHLMTEQEIKQYMGWTPASTTLKHYMFLDEQATNESYWKSQGVQLEEGKPKDIEKIKPVQCQCGHVNPAGEIFCHFAIARLTRRMSSTNAWMLW